MLPSQPSHLSNLAEPLHAPLGTAPESPATERRPSQTEIVYAVFVLAAGVLLLASAV